MKPEWFTSRHQIRPLWFLFLLAVMTWQSTNAQGLFSQSVTCGCPEVALRDTVWVSDNAGAGVGTETWTCDHLYVLTEQVFVNASDTLTIEPGTAVLGMAGEGRQSFFVSTNNAVGGAATVSYAVYPGALIVARGGYLHAEGAEACPIQFSFLGDPLDGSVGMDVQGEWGGLVLCGGGAVNTLYLEGVDQPSQTGGVGTGEDRAEGVVDLSGQDRHVYGGNTAPQVSSGTLKYVSLRHGSTNLGWNNALNGNETDLLQLAGCGEGTTLDFVELVASADDGLHVLGGTPDVRHVVSAFHAEDAFESDQGWQGTGQWLFGLQDTALAHPTNPPHNNFLWRMHGDDFEENNVDWTYEPYTSPWMSNLTLLSNGGAHAVGVQSLPAGDWFNSVIAGVSEAGIEFRHLYSCDGFPAFIPMNLPGGYGILRIQNWRIDGTAESASEVTPGAYRGLYADGIGLAMPSILADSNNVLGSIVVDPTFTMTNGFVSEGLDPRALAEGTVSEYYQTLNGELEEVAFHGAFAPAVLPWFEGWSALSAQGLFSGAIPGPGCTYPLACNYSAVATQDDGSCEFQSCAGCTYEWACNYDVSAVLDDGTCERETCAGCTFVLACNYDPAATQDDGSCTYEECSGCTFEDSPNYDPAALIDDGSCILVGVGNVCQGDLNGDGVISTLDLLDFLSVYGEVCPE